MITANGKTEKIASGLLNPFLAHLKTAQDQIAKGGYSIALEPDPATDAFWFTKGTVERFVRFVSTPEVLERVATIESEIAQIEDAITIQGNESLGLSTLEDHQTRSTGHIEGVKPVFDADAEKAIVLYKPGSQINPPESNGSTVQEENSKVQLLRVLETRKIVLQKEQGMAFARAAAAGFDVDHMAHLILFADCFGASRLKEACLKFMELWKVKHETGQWIEVEAAETMSTRSGFSPFNASGIVLAGDAGKQKDFVEASLASGGDLGIGSNGNNVTDHNSDKRLPSDPQVPPGPHEYFQNQFQHPSFSPWAMHPPQGPAAFQPYPMQAMPYYQNYPGSGPFYPPPYPSAEDPRFNTQQRVGRRHSMNSKDSGVYSESWEDDVDQSLSESEKEASHGCKSHKRGSRSGKKKAGVVVIRNLNYVTSKKYDKSGGESQTPSSSETEDGSEDSRSDNAKRKYKKSSGSSKKNDDHKKTPETSNSYDRDDVVYGNNADSGNWQAFQSFLLRAEEKMTNVTDGDIFTGEKDPPIKRRQNFSEAEPILIPERDSGNNHEASILEFDSASGKERRTIKSASNDEFLTSSEGRGLRESHLDAQFIEVERGGKGYRRVTTDDSLIYGHQNQIDRKSSSDPLADGYDHEHPGNVERSSYVATDESFIVPFRSGPEDQLQTDKRTAIDMDLEQPTSLQRKEDFSRDANNHHTYEPDDLTMLPERAFESDHIGYDPAMDYGMEMPVEVSVKQETKDAEDLSMDTKGELKKSNSEKKSKVQQDPLEKRRRDLMMRRGTSSKSNPLTEAQKRAEKLRAYKIDLQKAKKANEEEERKRLEALKIERQKRIAARSSSSSVQSPLATKQGRSGLPAKVSPSSFKGSKFSDSEPGSNSPLQKLHIRSSSIGSNDSQKIIKVNRLNGITNGLSKSVASLPEKDESNGLMPEAKTAATRTKRLSDPSVKNIQHASQKSVATDQIPKRNSANGPQMKKISAIVQLDKTRSATLPELKIRTPRGPPDTIRNETVTKDTLEHRPSTTQASGDVQEYNATENPPRASTSDDNPVIEKTVVMLENEMITGPVPRASLGMTVAPRDAKEWAGPDSDYSVIRALPSPVVVRNVEDPSQHKPDEELDCYEMVNNLPKDGFQNFSNSVTENFYKAPYARVTSLEDPAAGNLVHAETPNERSEFAPTRTESIKPRVHFSDSISIDQSNESIEKPRIKESKGFRKLLKFGRKSHSSASCEDNMDSDGLVSDDQPEAGSSNDVYILKNLISQDDSYNGGTSPRGHRSFSILSPFRSSKSNEKKLAA